MFLFVLCGFIGLYNLNSVLSFVALPAMIVNAIDIPLRIIGAVLIIVGGFLMIKLGKTRLQQYPYPPRR